MKVLDEEEILRELVAACLAEAAEINFIDNKNKNVTNNNNRRRRMRRNRNNNNNKENNDNNNNNIPITYTDQKTKLPFLLILVRKVQRKCYDFIYHPAETYERIEEIYQLTPVGAASASDPEGDRSSSAALQEERAVTSSASDDDEEGAVWTNGHASASSGSSTSSSSSGSSDEEEEEEEEEESSSRRHHHHHHEPFEPYYVGKAIFHTVSGDPLLKVGGSLGWREALKEKYNFLDDQSKAQVEKRSNMGASEKQKQRNHTAAKAVASAAIGGAGTTYAAAGMMATAATATETAAAATAATGGMMQTVGTVGAIAAAPLGLAAAGAIGGLGTYYFIHRRNKAKRNRKKRIEEEKEKLKYVEEMAQELAAASSSTTTTTTTTSSTTSPIDSLPLTVATELTQADMVEKDPNNKQNNNQYQRLSEDDPATSDGNRSNADFWVLVTAKRIEEMEDWEEYAYDHEVYEDQKDADQSFIISSVADKSCSSNTATAAAAKALFDPHGVVRRVHCCDPTDRDGWETALSVHYNYLIERQGSLHTTSSNNNEISNKQSHSSGTMTLDDTPLLLDE